MLGIIRAFPSRQILKYLLAHWGDKYIMSNRKTWFLEQKELQFEFGLYHEAVE